MLLQLCMLICPVSHICDGQKMCFRTMLQTSFFAHEIISIKLSKTQNFRKMRHFLNRAVINGLIYRMLPRLMVKINPPLAVMINHPLTVSVLPNPFHTTASQLYYSRNCVAQFHDIKAYFFNL